MKQGDSTISTNWKRHAQLSSAISKTIHTGRHRTRFAFVVSMAKPEITNNDVMRQKVATEKTRGTEAQSVQNRQVFRHSK